MKYSFRIFVCLLLFGFITGCGKPEEPAPETPDSTSAGLPGDTSTQAGIIPDLNRPADQEGILIAEWDGGKLYLDQVDRIVYKNFAEAIQSVTGNPVLQERFIEQIPAGRRETIKILADNNILIQEAKKRNLSLTPAQLDGLMKEFRGKFNTESEFRQALEKNGMNEEQLRNYLEEVHLARLCQEDQMRIIKDSITPETMREFYDKHVSDYFTPPGSISFNLVTISANEKRTLQEAKELAAVLYKEVQEKIEPLTDFDKKREVIQDYADRYSDHPSGPYNKGYLFYYTNGPEWESIKIAPEFRKEIILREPGELSNLVPFDETSYGFFLVKEKTEPFVSPFELDVNQNMIPNMIFKEKWEQWYKELYENYHFKIHEEKLNEPFPF